jgi:hypothetical protein
MTLDLVELLRRVNAVCITLAAHTTNTIDDKLTSAVAAILNNEALMQLLRSLLTNGAVTGSLGDARTEAIVKIAADSHTQQGETALRAAGLSWIEFVRFLPIIVRIGLTLLGKR